MELNGKYFLVEFAHECDVSIKMVPPEWRTSSTEPKVQLHQQKDSTDIGSAGEY